MISFKRKRPLFGTMNGGGRLIQGTFTRPSVAWWDGTPYIVDQPRFVDPSNSGIVGALIEEGATYLITQSSDLANAYWTKTGSSITAGVTTYQGVSLSRIVEAAGAGLHLIVKGTVLTVGQPGTVFCYAKADTRTKMRLAIDASTQFASFDLAAGTVIGATGVTATIEAKGGGVYLCAISAASVAVGNVYVYNMDAAGATSYTGDGASGVLVGGVQAIQKAYPLSYFPTAGSTATRAADTLTIPTNGLLTPSSGSVIIGTYLTGDVAAATPAAQHVFLDHRTAAGNENLLYIRREISTGRWQFITGNGSAVTQTANYTATLTGAAILCGAWDASSSVLAINGADRATAAGSSVPAALADTCSLGSSKTGIAQVNCPIRFVYFYNRKLSEAERAAATLGNPPPDFTAYANFQLGYVRGFTPGSNPAYVPDLFTSL